MRSILHLSLFIPALAGATLYTGTVSSLENHPLAGVVVKLGSDSIVTGHDGTWSLSHTAGIQSRDVKAIDGTRHLVRDGSRLSLAWQGHDILGRGPAMRKNLPSNQRAAIAKREISSTPVDTIVIRWNGKNLSRIQVSSSDTTIAQVIDTSWNDDAGIPWKTVTYGSVTDTAGQTYRTVKIGSHTWMAENLNFAGATGGTGRCYNDSVSYCQTYGRLHTWAEVMAGHVSSTTSPSGVQGLCPTGWHVPSDAEWTTMQQVVDARNSTDGTKLKSTSGWTSSGNGTDLYGFRALPGGYVLGGSFLNAGDLGIWWSTTENYASFAWNWFMRYGSPNVFRGDHSKTGGFSLRCLED